MSEEVKPKGKPVEIKLDEGFAPNNRDIKEIQKFASEVSPFFLELLEAEEEKT